MDEEKTSKLSASYPTNERTNYQTRINKATAGSIRRDQAKTVTTITSIHWPANEYVYVVAFLAMNWRLVPRCPQNKQPPEPPARGWFVTGLNHIEMKQAISRVVGAYVIMFLQSAGRTVRSEFEPNIEPFGGEES